MTPQLNLTPFPGQSKRGGIGREVVTERGDRPPSAAKSKGLSVMPLSKVKVTVSGVLGHTSPLGQMQTSV